MSTDPFAPYADRHVDTKGPGDARPTAFDIVTDENLVGGLKDKVCIITGAASGIGVETARAMHETGAKVYIMVRDTAKGQEVVDDILKNSKVEAEMGVIQIDLASMASVRRAAGEFLNKEAKLNILINNAGVMAIPERTLSVDGHEQQFAANHLGHFLLFQLLKPTLLASASAEFGSRVVFVASSGHRSQSVQFDDITLEKKYTPWGAYGQAKTAEIWTANEITRRYSSRNLTANSLNPGGIATPLQRHLDQAVMDGWARDPKVLNFMKNTAQGAATTIWAALAKVWEGRGGKYLEDCRIPPLTVISTPGGPGHASWAYDPVGERKLWKLSCEIVGAEDGA